MLACIAIMGGVLGVVIRWYFVTHTQVLAPLDAENGRGDAAEYYRYAWNLVHHGIFSGDVAGDAHPHSDSYRDPAYPAFLALLMSLTRNYDQWYAAVLLSQAVLGGLTVSFALLAVRNALPIALLIPAAIAMVLWPHLVSIPAYVLSENLTAFACALSALAIGEAARRNSIPFTVAAGLGLAVAALANAVLAPLIVPLVGILAWKRAMPLRSLLLLSGIVLAPLLAWGIRNAQLPTTISSSFRAEINLVQGSWPTYHMASQLWGRGDPVGIQTIDAITKEIAILHADRRQGLKVMAERMSKAPGTYALWYLRKPTLLWGWEIGLGAGDIYAYPTRNSPFITNPLMRSIEAFAYIFNGVLALCALIGAAIVLRSRHPDTALLVLTVTCLWITLVYWVLQSDSRYSIPYRPAEIALACVAIYALAVRLGQSTKIRSENVP
jgi:hypothetical protein